MVDDPNRMYACGRDKKGEIGYKEGVRRKKKKKKKNKIKKIGKDQEGMNCQGQYIKCNKRSRKGISNKQQQWGSYLHGEKRGKRRGARNIWTNKDKEKERKNELMKE